MNIRKLESSYALQDYPRFIQWIVKALGMESTSGKPHTESHQRQSTGRWRWVTNTSTNFQDLCCQSTVHQSSSSRHSAQRGHILQINEDSDDNSNTKTREAYPELDWDGRSVAYTWSWSTCRSVESTSGQRLDWWQRTSSKLQWKSSALSRMHSADVDTHMEDKSFFEHRGQSVWHSSGVIKGLGAAQLFQECKCKAVSLLQTDS